MALHNIYVQLRVKFDLGSLLNTSLIYISFVGAKHLLHGLCSNTSIRALDLKGNNMRGASAEAMGKLFRQNHSIKR